MEAAFPDAETPVTTPPLAYVPSGPAPEVPQSPRSLQPRCSAKEVLRSLAAVAQQALYLTSARQPSFEFRQEGVISFQSA